MSRARDTIKVPMPGAGLIEVWITRDSIDGDEATGKPPVLADGVIVWAVPPMRLTDEAGAFWVGEVDSDIIARIHMVQASWRFRTLPATDRECVRCWIKGV